jgi:hypothetical protein
MPTTTVSARSYVSELARTTSQRVLKLEGRLTPQFSCGRFYFHPHNPTTWSRPSAATFVRQAAKWAQLYTSAESGP